MSLKLPHLASAIAIVSLSFKFVIKRISGLFYCVFEKDKEDSSLNMTVFHKSN